MKILKEELTLEALLNEAASDEEIGRQIADKVNAVSQEFEDSCDNEIYKALDKAYELSLKNQELGDSGAAKQHAVVILEGATGVGKSTVVDQWAKNHQPPINLSVKLTSAMEPTDVGGQPGLVMATWSVNRFGTTEFDCLEKPNSVLFLDEFNRGLTQTTNSLLDALVSHKVRFGATSVPAIFYYNQTNDKLYTFSEDGKKLERVNSFGDADPDSPSTTIIDVTTHRDEDGDLVFKNADGTTRTARDFAADYKEVREARAKGSTEKFYPNWLFTVLATNPSFTSVGDISAWQNAVVSRSYSVNVEADPKSLNRYITDQFEKVINNTNLPGKRRNEWRARLNIAQKLLNDPSFSFMTTDDEAIVQNIANKSAEGSPDRSKDGSRFVTHAPMLNPRTFVLCVTSCNGTVPSFLEDFKQLCYDPNIDYTYKGGGANSALNNVKVENKYEMVANILRDFDPNPLKKRDPIDIFAANSIDAVQSGINNDEESAATALRKAVFNDPNYIGQIHVAPPEDDELDDDSSWGEDEFDDDEE